MTVSVTGSIEICLELETSLYVIRLSELKSSLFSQNAGVSREVQMRQFEGCIIEPINIQLMLIDGNGCFEPAVRMLKASQALVKCPSRKAVQLSC